jgi:plasmid maintenance system killer protein
MDLFVDDPTHPSLRIEKLRPRDRDAWSFRLNRGYRTVFRFLEDGRVLLLAVGQHEKIYRM